MECLYPIEGFRQPDGTVRLVGERSDSAVQRAGHLEVACGRCRGCRVERSRQWAVRMMHEASTSPTACFLTLTYSDEHLPEDGSVSSREVTLFVKRMRKQLRKPLRYFACGEYGDRFGRPHYHMALFGEDFRSDGQPLPKTKTGFPQWTSPQLEQLWGKGRVAVMDVSFDSAQYVAKYVTKKVNGAQAAAHYHGRRPEFASMSKRPAIGLTWFRQFHRDVYPSDECVVEGRPGRPPRYYDKVLEKEDPELYEFVKSRRRSRGLRRKGDDDSRERRAVRAELAERRLRAFARDLSGME